MPPSIDEILKGVSVVAQEYSIKRVDLFGSVATGRATEHSDVDLLVEFMEPRVSLLTLNGLKYRLEELLESDVDVIHGPLSADSMIEIDERISLYGA